MRKALEIDLDCSKYWKIDYSYLKSSGGSAARLTPIVVVVGW
jgi:hypothetical protein